MKFIIKRVNLSVAFTLAMLFVAGTVSAAPINVNGVFDAGEAYTGSRSIQWYNNHHTIYGESENLMNTMQYSMTANSLNLFLEVPDYARVMIWSQGVEYFDTTLCSPGPGDPCGGLDSEYLELYRQGSHHESGGKKKVKMDYGTQTGSEYFRLVTNSGDDLCFGLQNDGGHCDKDDPSDRKTFTGGDTGPNTETGTAFGDVTWATSRDYVLANGCSEAFCDRYDTTMSLELVMMGLAPGRAQEILDSITDLNLHLSDEAAGLPAIPPVPIPGALWLFGSALLGFAGIRRKRAA